MITDNRSGMSASKYDIDVDLGAEGTSHRYMVELVGSNKTVLDVGCASGYLAKTLGAFGNTVTGVEYDPAAAREAQAHTTRVLIADLDHTDLTELLAGETFDVIVFGDVLEHLRDPLPPLRQARNLLKPGGYIVVSVPNVSHGDVRMSLLLGRFPYGNLGLLDTTHLRFYTRSSLRELLADAGLVATEVRTTKAPLFETEIGVRQAEVDPAVVETIRQDEDSTTYQFVMTAVPHSATTIAEATAWQLRSTEAAMAQLRREFERVTGELTGMASELATAQEDLGESSRALTAERERAAALSQDVAKLTAERRRAEPSAPQPDPRAVAAEAELRALSATRTFRWRENVLRALGRVRG